MLKELRLDDTAPWKQRFRAPNISWTQLAKAAPTRGLVVSNPSGVDQLYAWHAPTGELRQLTQRPEGTPFGFISADGRYVYYHDDQHGDEIGHYVRVPFEGGGPQDITPDLPPYSSFNFTASQSGDGIGFTLAKVDGFSSCCIDLGPDGALGTPRILYRSRRLAVGPVLSYGSEIVVMASSERTGMQHFDLLAFDIASGAKFAQLWDGPGSSIEPIAFSPLPGDFRLLASTNRTGVKRALIWNPRTSERIAPTLDELEGEVTPLDWSADANRILLSQFSQAVERLHVYDLSTAALTPLNHPGGTFTFYGLPGAYFGPGDEVFAHWQDATHPEQLIVLDSVTGNLVRTALTAGEAPPGHAWKSVTFTSSDATLVQGWLSLPDGEGPFPTILHTHGGPEAVMTECFHAESQAWLDHGFAFLTINYRGSTTFGRKFQEQIWGDLGRWEIEDMVAARDWLCEHGIARPDQVLLTGWSYGGYLTLLALGKRPELWAGGMAGMPVVDWVSMYEDSADTLKGYQVAMFGGTREEKPEQYAASSPITYAEHVKAPVLIVTGRNDTRTPARPIEAYEAKLKALGKSIEVH
ncbi:MAG: prolyl oligopeptidase family serine peptidase, partial [Anaerolineae bacterium]